MSLHCFRQINLGSFACATDRVHPTFTSVRVQLSLPLCYVIEREIERVDMGWQIEEGFVDTCPLYAQNEPCFVLPVCPLTQTTWKSAFAASRTSFIFQPSLEA